MVDATEKGSSVDFDVIVVGAGPAGLAAAERIAQENGKVIVLEKNPRIGYPVCTTGVSWIRDMRFLGIPEDLYHVLARCRFVSPSNEVVIRYPPQEACVMNVRGTYQLLAKRATTAGARIELRATVLNPIVQNGYVKGIRARVHGKECKLYSRIVIDASGVSAVIARKTGLQGRLARFGSGAEYELYAPNCNAEEEVIILDDNVSPCGYGWIVPCGNGRVRAGVAIIHPDSSGNPRSYLDRLVKGNHRFEALFHNAEVVEYHSGMVPSAGVNKRFVGNGLVIVGDAAGQPSPLIGEGIRYAIYAGHLAANVVTEAIKRSEYSERFLSRYEMLWRKRYDRNHRVAYVINRKIAPLTGEKWDRHLKYLENMSPRQFTKFLKCEFGIWWALGILFRNPKLSRVVLCELIKDPFWANLDKLRREWQNLFAEKQSKSRQR